MALIKLFDLMNNLTGKTSSLKRFAVYYGSDEKAEAFSDFDLVVLESSYSKIVASLKKEKKIVLAYLSFGEVNSSREYFSVMKEKGLILENNPNWPDAFLVDIRKSEWVSFVLKTLIPAILDKGFDGIFIDTVDSSMEKERMNPREFRGMMDSAVAMIEKTRKEYPNIKIMLNRAYGIVSDVARCIDYILGESISNTYDFSTRKYLPVQKDVHAHQLKILSEVKERNPGIQVMTLDYCDDKDHSRRREIYREQEKNGFIPYVTTIDLCKISKIYGN